MTPDEELEFLELKRKRARARSAATPVPVSKEPGDAAQRTPNIDDIEARVAADYDAKASDRDSALVAVARGVEQGGSFKFADEAVAGLSSLPVVGRYLATPIGGLLQGDVRPETTYKDALSDTRKDFKKSEDEHPVLYNGAELATSMAMPVPAVSKVTKLGKLAKAGVNIARAGGLGAAAGLGASEADLAGGDLAGAAKDTGISGLIGAGVGAAGELAGLLGRVFSGKASKAEARLLEMEVAKRAKAANRAGSAVGGETSAGSNAIGKLREIAANADGLYPGDLVAVAKEKLSSDYARELATSVGKNAVEGFERRQPSLASARQKLAEAIEHNAPEAAEAAAAEAGTLGAAGSKVWDRAWRYGGRAVGGLVGGAIGGWPGALVGGAIGGNPGTAVGNLIRDPSVRKVAFTALSFGARAPEWLASQTGLPAAVAAEVLGQLSTEDGTPKAPDVTPAHYGGGP